ncbi:MAG: diadenylate cyclase CdaA [Clostridia bacterium]|nr:diadenylate cyclase CdaA [Clostridia bacterium]
MELAVWNVTHRISWIDVLDILIVSVIIYEIILLTRQTRGSAVLKGLVFLLLATGVSTMLGLTSLNWMLMALLNNGALVLIILFQPELRKALESLGRGTRRSWHSETEERERIIREIIQCMTDLSRRRVGALLVFERQTGLNDVMRTGTAIDGLISAPLLENIFEPNTPLHDGAVIIRGTRVMAGACILPVTDDTSVDRDLGTRHRASIAISEVTDAVVLIVSEETGIMSVAQQGRLTRHHDADSLRRVLEGLYHEPAFSFRNLFKKQHPVQEEEP